MGTRTIRGRTALDRAGVAAFTGRSDKTVEYWYQHRVETGFPEPLEIDHDGRHWYPQTEISKFWKRHQAALHDRLPNIDRSGDPEELVTAPQAARILGLADRNSLHKDLLDNPDDTEQLPSGRLRKRWRRATLWEHAEERQAERGGGRPAGTHTTPTVPFHYANDERLNAAIKLVEAATAAGRTTAGLGTKLAQDLRIAERTAQRLIAAARKTVDGSG